MSWNPATRTMPRVDDEGKVEGYASTFGNVDLGLDVIEKGAFKKTLQENKGVVPILADHNPSDQIGWNKEAFEDSKGLSVKGALNLKVQKAIERHALSKQALEVGGKAGLSIGYMTIKAEPDRENPRIRRLKELKLFEYSLVTFPMNTASFVTAAKSLGQVDKAKFLLSHLADEGISIKDLELALQSEAVNQDFDPTQLSQSIDNLIAKFKS
jgi:HK97 family phage prohead protease